jgi:hypothetical protein
VLEENSSGKIAESADAGITLNGINKKRYKKVY